MADSGCRPAEPSGAVIDQCLGQLKDGYMCLARQLHPGKRKAGGKPAEWEALAAALARRNLDPYEYLQYCYDVVVPHVRHFCASAVLPLANVHRFAKDKPDLDQRRALLVELQFVEVERRLMQGDTIDVIICDSRASLSAVFRYAVAKAFGLQELVGQLGEDARHMLLFKPVYRRLLHGLLEEKQKHGGVDRPNAASAGQQAGTGSVVVPPVT